MKSNIMSIINNIITIIILILFCVVMYSVIFYKDSPYKGYNIVSESMYPEYNVGAFILSKKVDFDSLEIGDNIVFYSQSTMDSEDRERAVITHQIIEVLNEPGGVQYKTQGVNNNTPDAHPVTDGNYIGRIFFTADGLGYIFNDMKKIPFMITTGVLVLLLWFLPWIDKDAE